MSERFKSQIVVSSNVVKDGILGCCASNAFGLTSLVVVQSNVEEDDILGCCAKQCQR